MNRLNKHLYQFCDPWFHGGSVYFYSDPHFGDEEMNAYRGITDEEQINKINKVVHKADTLVILGDVGDIECVKKLKAGYKVLIMGNHDSGKSKYQGKYIEFTEYDELHSELMEKEDYTSASAKFDETIKADIRSGKIDYISYRFHSPFVVGYKYNRLFDEVYDGPLTISDKIILSHEPLDVKYHLNIHGHNHNKDTEDKYHINCCAEWLEYDPLSLNVIIKVGTLSQIQSIHRETINSATERSKNKKKDK